MGFFEAYKICIQKYAKFDGRARRKEYWYFSLINGIISAVLTGISFAIINANENLIGLAVAIAALYSLFVFLPGLAVMVRRFHDTGTSGAYIFMSLIPAIGEILVLIRLCQDSDMGPNKFGENPKGINSSWQQAVVGGPGVQSAQVPAGGQNRPAPSPAVTPIAPNPEVFKAAPAVPAAPAAPAASPASWDATARGAAAPTSGASHQQVRVTCIAGPAPGQSIVFAGPVYLGRDSMRCRMCFPNGTPGISKSHCVVRPNGSTVELTDLASSYGTYLSNGQRLQPNMPVQLRSGDTFMLASRNVVVKVELV